MRRRRRRRRKVDPPFQNCSLDEQKTCYYAGEPTLREKYRDQANIHRITTKKKRTEVVTEKHCI